MLRVLNLAPRTLAGRPLGNSSRQTTAVCLYHYSREDTAGTASWLLAGSPTQSMAKGTTWEAIQCCCENVVTFAD